MVANDKAMNQIGRYAGCALMAALLMLAGGCKTAMPKPSGFLTDYSHLTEVNDSMWQYVDAAALSGCDKFIIPPVKIIATEYAGTAFTEDQSRRISESFHEKIVKAVSAKYQVVRTPSPTTAEIRVALTRIYRVGTSIAIGVEAEIDNSESHQQLAAVSGVKVGPPELSVNTNVRAVNDPGDPGHNQAPWWNRPAADELMDGWSAQLVKVIAGAGKH